MERGALAPCVENASPPHAPTQVVKAKHEKLGGVVRKIFSRMGTIAEDGLTHPFDEATQLTKGFAFVNFLNPQDAKAAATLNGWQLDKSHNIKVRTACHSPHRSCRLHRLLRVWGR